MLGPPRGHHIMAFIYCRQTTPTSRATGVIICSAISNKCNVLPRGNAAAVLIALPC